MRTPLGRYFWLIVLAFPVVVMIVFMVSLVLAFVAADDR
jgi:hypothetical protein